MDRFAAQDVLRRYRPGTSDELDAEVKEALALAAQDPELSQWLERQLAVGRAVRSAVRSAPVPPDLHQLLLDAEFKRRREQFWKHTLVRYAIAASVALFASLLFLQYAVPSRDEFGAYRDRMVKFARRSYRMDMLSADLGQIRTFLAKSHNYEDFALPAGLQHLPGIGCAVLHWHDRPVSLVCLESPEHKILYLFVTTRTHWHGEPDVRVPDVQAISTLTTASWSQGDKTYFLASEDSAAVKQLVL